MEQLHKIFKLCGSPPDDYWSKLEVPQAGMFKPSRQYSGCIAETFKDFPHSVVLLDNLLALQPYARGTAAETLRSDVSSTHLLLVTVDLFVGLEYDMQQLAKSFMLFQ